MNPRHLYGRLVGDADKVADRSSHKGPMVARVFVGTTHINPRREMGGPTICPSVTLSVYPDGSWTVTETKDHNTRAVAEGTL